MKNKEKHAPEGRRIPQHVHSRVQILMNNARNRLMTLCNERAQYHVDKEHGAKLLNYCHDNVNRELVQFKGKLLDAYMELHVAQMSLRHNEPSYIRPTK